MFRYTCPILMLALLLAAGSALAQSDPPATTQPHETAVAPDHPDAADAPTTQPDKATAQPDEADAQPRGLRPGHIGFLLTRNVPEHLREKHQLLWAQATEAQRKEIRRRFSTLRANFIDLQGIVQARKEFQDLKPQVQDRYRQRAELIEQILDKMTPSEKARVLAMPVEERAKFFLEEIARLKAEQARETDTNQE